MDPLKIGDKIAKYPIIQGGMGVGISLSSLAGAVAKEGGIGIISTAQIGFSEPEYKTSPLETNLKMIGEHIKRARKIAPGGILGVNIMVATKHYAEYVKKAVQHGIDLIISGAGLPTELPSLTKGTATKLVPIVSSVKAASVILKLWDKKDKVCPDAIIVEGPKAGGHLGFREDEISSYSDERFESEIKDIIDLVKGYEDKYQKEIPVIAAGGIRNKEDVRRYLSLGARGVQVASLFVTTKECDAHDKYKQAYLDCKEEDIVIVKSPVGMPGRAMSNKFLERIREQRVPSKCCRDCIITCNPKETRYCISDALINAATGKIDEALLFCGANAYEQNEIRTVKEVMRLLLA